MGKYDQIPLRKVKARIEHQCSNCECVIHSGDYYYTQRNKFLQSLHRTKFCSKCYRQHGEKLLKMTKKRAKYNLSKRLDEYV